MAAGAITGSSGSAQHIPVRRCQALAQTQPELEQRVPARPLRVPAAPWGPGWAQEFPGLGDLQLRDFESVGEFLGTRPSPVTHPAGLGAAGERWDRGKVRAGDREGTGRGHTGLPGDGTGRRRGQKAPGETRGVTVGTDVPAGEGSWSSCPKAVCDLCRGLEDKSAALC